jgi:hypothetical protein
MSLRSYRKQVQHCPHFDCHPCKCMLSAMSPVLGKFHAHRQRIREQPLGCSMPVCLLYRQLWVLFHAAPFHATLFCPDYDGGTT